MIPSIKLPNNLAPHWLRPKLRASGAALSARSPQGITTGVTAVSTPALSGGGLSASSPAVKSSVKGQSLGNLFTGVQSTAAQQGRAIQEAVKALQRIYQLAEDASKSAFYLTSAAVTLPESEGKPRARPARRSISDTPTTKE